MSKEQHLPLSFSSLKAFARSPRAFLEYKKKRRPPSAAMEFGTLVHRAALEPDIYEDSVAVWEGRRAGGRYDRFCQENPECTVITAQRYQEVRECQSALMSHGLAGGLLSDLDAAEMKFEINQVGIPHTGYIDGILPWAVIDLKVTKSVEHWALQRTIYDYKYYMQAAIYQRAAELMGYEPESYFIVAVEPVAPYHVAVVELEPHYIARGHLEWEGLLDRFKEWDGEPAHQHGKDDSVPLMDAPSWVPPLDLES
jgi:hypothetical protein